MSPRAAWRLESLGFTRVFDYIGGEQDWYVGGEQDWFAFGLPREGKAAAVPHAGDLARRDAPTCGLTDRIGEVRDQVQAAGWNACVVVNHDRIVLGLLREQALAGDPQAAVEAVMEIGPSAFRPSALVTEVLDYLQRRNRDSAVITKSNGRLVGLLQRGSG